MEYRMLRCSKSLITELGFLIFAVILASCQSLDRKNNCAADAVSPNLPSAQKTSTPRTNQTANNMILVERGVAKAVVVLPDESIPSQELASREFIYHVRKATGAELPLYRESKIPADAKYRVYIGSCKAAVQAGIDVEKLPPSGYVVKTSGNSLFIAGRDRQRVSRDDKNLAKNLGKSYFASWNGTLNGVYDFLENDMGVRWVFPGELGEQVQHTDDLTIMPTNRSGKPRFKMTEFYLGGVKHGNFPGWSSQQSHDAYHNAQQLFLLRHRFGAVEMISYGHNYNNYWKRFGKTNPQFFNRLPNGARRPLDLKNGHNVTLCVSQPLLWKQIIEDWKNSPERKPDNILYKPMINACENDSPGMCTCTRCRSWDAPDPGFKTHDYWGKKIIPADKDRFFIAITAWGELEDGKAVTGEPPSVSDRYARFYMELVKEARKVEPNAKVAGLAYCNYWKAPVNPNGNLDLHGVMIEYVPPIFFPYTEKMGKEFKESWEGWSKLGAEMMLRPNLTHAGANLPIFYARQIADDFSFAAKHGMVGTSFDSLLGAWSAQGPTMYVLMRIHEHPDWPVDKMLDEYYVAFGPAKEQVREYFNFWEKHSNAITAEQVEKYNAEEKGGGFKNYIKIAHRLFSPQDFATARDFLNKARRAAVGNTIASKRVEYLEQGLTDAELTTATRAAQARMEKEDTPENRAGFEAAFSRMINYRTRMEAGGLYPSNIGYFAYREMRGAAWPYEKYQKQPGK